MKEYQKTSLETIVIDSLTAQFQYTGNEPLQSVCDHNVACPGNPGPGFTDGFCSDDFANGEVFLPESKPTDSPQCTITANGVTAACEANLDQDNSCSEGSFWFLSCEGDYNCDGDSVTIHCDGYVDGPVCQD